MKIKSEQNLAEGNIEFEVEFTNDDLKMMLIEYIERMAGVKPTPGAEWMWNASDRGGGVRWSVPHLTFSG